MHGGHEEGNAYDYGLLHRHLHHRGRLIPNYKEELRKALLRYKEQNRSISGYFDNLERHGYYARVLTSGGHPSVVYGLRGTSYYISGEKLDYRLSYNGLATHYTEESRGKSLEERSRMKIEGYIKRHVGRCLRRAYGAGMLESLLAKRGIEVAYAANRSGVYGVSFKSSYGTVEGHVVKGSKIGYSWQKLCWHLERNRGVMVRKQVRLGRNKLGSKGAGVRRGEPLLRRVYASVMRGLPALQAVYAQQAAAAEWSMKAGLVKEAAIRQNEAQMDMEEGQDLEGDFSQGMGM